MHDEGGLNGGHARVSDLGGDVKLSIGVVGIVGGAVVDGEFFMVWKVWWDVVYPWV